MGNFHELINGSYQLSYQPVLAWIITESLMQISVHGHEGWMEKWNLDI